MNDLFDTVAGPAQAPAPARTSRRRNAAASPPPLPAKRTIDLPGGRGRVGAQYMKGEANPFFHTWKPALREAADDVRAAYTRAASRAVDTIQNSGWIAGGVEQAVVSTVGTGLRLASKPDAEALGWTHDEAAAWAQLVERRFEGWANRPVECDLEGKSNLGKMSAQAVRTHFCFGEVLAGLPYVKRPFNQYGTKVQLLPPSRLSQETSAMDNLFQGVFRDPTGFPTGYRIMQPQNGNVFSMTRYRDIAARDRFGRPNVVHVFDGFPGQVRGIPLITPALKVVRQFEQISDATLTAGLIQAIFAATVHSDLPTDQAMQAFQDLAEQATMPTDGSNQTSPFEAMMEMRAGWYEGTNIDLGSHGKIAHLAPGDKLEFHASNHPNDTYESFVRFLLREIARCLGITFEQLTGDYTGATYSSVRMATSEIWMMTIYRRVHVVAPFLQAAFEAWLEEDIERGWIEFPGGVEGFINNRAAATRAHWRGPAKPQADDLKFAKAIETLRSIGVVSDEWICAELGEDWEDVMEQRAREKAKREALGLPESTSPIVTPGNDPALFEERPANG